MNEMNASFYFNLPLGCLPENLEEPVGSHCACCGRAFRAPDEVDLCPKCEEGE